MSVERCREMARRFFRAAVAEEDQRQRERLLVQGEAWMLRSRLWTPTCGYRFDDRPDPS